MKIVSTWELSGRDVITFIQLDNNNKTSLKTLSEQTEGLEQSGINK